MNRWRKRKKGARSPKRRRRMGLNIGAKLRRYRDYTNKLRISYRWGLDDFGSENNKTPEMGASVP
eukprot:3339608-Pleurochrysis_carterae.AAC.1